MTRPSFAEYCDALSGGPAAVLADPVLAHGRLRTHATGRPVVHGGTFALTFEIDSDDGRHFALRCFHKELDALDLRYEAICAHLARYRSPHFVDVQFQPTGIRTDSGWHPVVRMDWAEGPTLATFVAAHRRDPERLLEVRDALRCLAEQLASMGVAHGDIQPANVIVHSPSHLVLVDYDCLYVPDLAPFRSPELGQRNFQHPGRRARHFHARLDAFAFAVIDLALDALRVAPELWEETASGSDAFLLRAADFADPAGSRAFERISRLEGLSARAGQLAAACLSTFSAMPPLEQLLTGSPAPSRRIVFTGDSTIDPRHPYVSPYEVLDATDFAQCCAHVGDRVELVGPVRRRVAATTADPSRLNERVEFGTPGHDTSCLLLPSEVARELLGPPGHAAADDWLSATGLLEPVATEVVDGRRQKVVTLSLDDASQVIRLRREEAARRLSGVGRRVADADAGGEVRTDPVVIAAEQPASAARPAAPPQAPPPPPPPPRPAPTQPRRSVRRPTPPPRVDPHRPPITGPPRWRSTVPRGIWAGVAFVSLAASALWLASSPGRLPPPPETSAPPVEAVVSVDEPTPVPAPAPPSSATVPLLWAPIADPERQAITAAGRIAVVADSGESGLELLVLDGAPLQEPRGRRIELLYQAAAGGTDVVAGIIRCPAASPTCAHDHPFWMELSPGESPRLRTIPGLVVAPTGARLAPTDTGPGIDLGMWDGERRVVDLTGNGNLVVSRAGLPPRRLSNADCSAVIRSLEACAASRDCDSLASSASRLSEVQRERLESLYHESTGLDAEAYRTLCRRSCELGLTPSAAFVRRETCGGSAPGQWARIGPKLIPD